MQRRSFIQALFGFALYPSVGRAAPKPQTEPSRILIQESPLAGFQYHQGETAWFHLRPGQPLHLVREPYNRHDPRAVAVYWRETKLGYVPRTENTAVAQLLDRGQTLEARIVALKQDPNPWRRLRFAVTARA